LIEKFEEELNGCRQRLLELERSCALREAVLEQKVMEKEAELHACRHLLREKEGENQILREKLSKERIAQKQEVDDLELRCKQQLYLSKRLEEGPKR